MKTVFKTLAGAINAAKKNHNPTVVIFTVHGYALRPAGLVDGEVKIWFRNEAAR